MLVPVKSESRFKAYKVFGDNARTAPTDVYLPSHSSDPFSYTGVVAFFDCSALHNAFAYAHVLEIPAPTRRSTADGSLSPFEPLEGSVNLKITKVGILDRKDDLVEGGKKANSRKWKSWSVLLTGSQLLLFVSTSARYMRAIRCLTNRSRSHTQKDTLVASTLQEQILARAGTLSPPQSEKQRVFLPRMPTFRPDAVLSLYDAIALYDFTYAKYTNVFRLVQPNGRQILFRAEEENSLNSWIGTINYGAAFRTAGVRMRGATNPMPHSPASAGLDLSLPLPTSTDGRPPQAKMSTVSTISAASRDDGVKTEELSSNKPASNGSGVEQRQRPSQPYAHDSFIFYHSTTSDLRDAIARKYNSRGNIVRVSILAKLRRDCEEQALEASYMLTDDGLFSRKSSSLKPRSNTSRRYWQPTSASFVTLPFSPPSRLPAGSVSIRPCSRSPDGSG